MKTEQKERTLIEFAKTAPMKTKLILLMLAHILLYAFSIYQIVSGSIYFGMFNMTLNSAFFVVNIYTLKRVLRS